MMRSNWWLVLCFAVGAAALVLAWVPSAWPNPLGEGPADQGRALVRFANGGRRGRCRLPRG